ncbi:MAG: alpha-galactosidase, partial [Pirellulaceae bacterium]|nr:alpha-galactosidase [Pirellulaceae bacterium]
MNDPNLSTDINVREAPEREVLYTSGKTIYVEALTADRWVARYWNAGGRVNHADERACDDAFQLQIDGERLSAGWQWMTADEDSRPNRGARHFVVELANQIRPINVKIHTLLDGTPVLTRWLEIFNRADKTVALTDISPWSGVLWSAMPGNTSNIQTFTLGYFTKSDWAWEGWFDWRALPDGTTVIRCVRGQGHDDPFFIVRNETKGEYFIGHLAWSANWQMAFERKPGDSESHLVRPAEGLEFKIGPSAENVHRTIASGETIHTPAVHLGHVEGDLDTTVQAMHDHLRRFVLPIREPQRSCLVQVVVPGDQGYLTVKEDDDTAYLFDETNVRHAIDVAAAVGAELFILDACWWDVPGDWCPSATRFPNGIKPIREYARQKQLLFGLYVEMEGGRGPMHESKLGREHPDWLGPKGILNLTNPEAAEWMEKDICRVIDEYQPDLYRLDYNPLFTFEGPSTLRDGCTENNYWRYYEAFYAIYERIAKKYPKLILQQCAAGGARNDLGTASRFHETYLTDGLWMPHVLQVYSGLTLGLPPEVFVTAIGAPG